MKLLFIDDRAGETGLSELANDMDIEIVQERTAQDGLARLEQEYRDFDGVVLDALGLLDNSPQAQAENPQALSRCINGIKELERRNGAVIPFCVWTGYPENVSSFLDPDIIVFSKDQGGRKVLDHMTKVALDRPGYRVRKNFQEVFSIIDEIGRGDDRTPEYKNSILEILTAMVSGHTDIVPDQYYNTLRKLVELMLRDANKAGLLHDECIRNAGKKGLNVTESIKFLAGENVSLFMVCCSKTHIDEARKKDVDHIMNKLNEHSHTEDASDKVHENTDLPGSRFALFGLTMLLVEQLTWYAAYKKEHPDVNANKALWQEVKPEAVQGEVINVNEKGAKLKPGNGDRRWIHIPGRFVRDHRLKNGTLVDAEVMDNDRGRIVTGLSVLVR